MHIQTYELPMDANIFCFGDTHDGSEARSKPAWEYMVDMINSKCYGLAANRNFAYDSGDMTETILPDDRRHDPAMHKVSLLDQITMAIKNRAPIKKKMIAVLDGNHPKHRSALVGSVSKKIAEGLGVFYGGWTCHTTYHNKNNEFMFKHYGTHGKRACNSTNQDPYVREAAMKLALKKALFEKFSDCMLMTRGHTHQLIVRAPVSPLHLYVEGGEIEEGVNKLPPFEDISKLSNIPADYRWYVSTGTFHRTFMKGDGSYGEEGEYNPVTLGFAVVKVREGKIVDVVREVV